MSSAQKRATRGRPSIKGGTGSEGAQSIVRAARLLFSLANGRSGIGYRASRLSEILDLPQPTVHRMLKALETQNLVTQDEVTARWRLGCGVYELGLAVTPDQRLLTAAEAVLDRLRDATGNTSIFVIRSGQDSVCLSLSSATDSRIPILEVGMRRPLGVGATGLAMLAALDETDSRATIIQNAARYESYDGIDPQLVAQLVQDARRRGYSRTLGEFYPDVAGVSVAWRSSRRAVCSISIIGNLMSATDNQAASDAMLLRSEIARMVNDVRVQS